MKLKYFLLLTIFFILTGFNVFSQDKKTRRADETFEKGEYYQAIKEYSEILKKTRNKKQKNEIYYKRGEAYYMLFEYKKARSDYKRTIKDKEFEYFAKVRLAEIEIQEGNYEEAVSYYQDILRQYPEDSIGKKGLESVNMAIQWEKEPTRFKVELAKHLNSKENDFTPTVDEKDGYDHIYFSSTRAEAKGKKKSKITGGKLADIFVTKYDRKGVWSKPEPLDSINTIYDEGAPCIFDKGRKFYYTSCQSEKGKNIGCQIYEAQKIDGIWMKPVRLEIVGDSVSIGHPAVSPDGDILYFSGNLEGGHGGTDIWYSEKSSGGWSKPKNMGPDINSPGDEMFPFVRSDGTFYYSSSKPPTMGGLDIFYAVQDENGKWISDNMKPPFNSNGNDFGIYYYANEDRGYFTSDRKGSKSEDIYYFEKPPLEFVLTGIVKDKDNMYIIDSAVITLYGSDGSMFIDTVYVKETKGLFNFKLKSNTDYVFVVTKDSYFNGKSRLSTDSLDFSKTFQYEILLESFNKTFEIPNIEFEFGRWDLSESSKVTLDSLIRIMNDNPYIVIELSAHTDMVGTDESNMQLSQRRANSVVEYFKQKGIPQGRLIAVGYGKRHPKKIIQTDNRYPFLPVGTVLEEDFIMSLSPEQQVVANQQNRRIEMKVISNDYMPDLDW
ncbi:MAG: OmpA family protein [Bacteroidales bacterium]|jgi:peptidoglycan-associated lipoprotein|nr:OmpA family protein [Bacteroidales bacterium]